MDLFNNLLQKITTNIYVFEATINGKSVKVQFNTNYMNRIDMIKWVTAFIRNSYVQYKRSHKTLITA
jgi:hypothetical protein